MRKFILKALAKFNKLDEEQIKKLLKDIAENNELLEMVLESMTDGVMVTDKENNLILNNKSSERLIPFSNSDILEKKIWSSIDDQEIADFLKEKLENQEKVIDRIFVLGNGTTRSIAVSIMPLVKLGTIHGNLIHIEDVTEKRVKEARLRRAENLAALTTLAAGVAHEIKNPLGSISIHLQLIEKEMNTRGSIKPKNIQHYLDVINEEVTRLNKIVVDFLFAVRPMDTNLVESDINKAINNLLNFLKFELKEANVKLIAKFSENLPNVLLDEKYFKQALLNLIQNSLSAMPKGGNLTIETLQKDSDVLVKITDTGTGIPVHIREKIFEPYFTTKEFGSGLGLTLVYKIIKEHMGDITVSSKEGKGTTIILTFGIPQKEKRLLGYKGEKDEV